MKQNELFWFEWSRLNNGNQWRKLKKHVSQTEAHIMVIRATLTFDFFKQGGLCKILNNVHNRKIKVYRRTDRKLFDWSEVVRADKCSRKRNNFR
ncbi:MAG: hypothetical protein ACTS46_00460 [Candidatus Hodgkinia cicadicola]